MKNINYEEMERKGIFRDMTLSDKAFSEGRKNEAFELYAVARIGYNYCGQGDFKMLRCLNELEKKLGLPLTKENKGRYEGTKNYSMNPIFASSASNFLALPEQQQNYSGGRKR